MYIVVLRNYVKQSVLTPIANEYFILLDLSELNPCLSLLVF